MQSINLRAALLRALETAKKNGVLSRDSMIRKTMLDDCKGERLEEVLAYFSTAVLKKILEGDDDESFSSQRCAVDGAGGLFLAAADRSRENIVGPIFFLKDGKRSDTSMTRLTARDISIGDHPHEVQGRRATARASHS